MTVKELIEKLQTMDGGRTARSRRTVLYSRG
jgi:hypothetical protein